MSDGPAVVAADVLLLKDGKVLLNLRDNTWGAGYYGVPGGHVESGEDFETAAIREMSEELGITIQRPDLRLVHVMYRPGSDRDKERVNLKFVCERWSGEPRNVEPDKSKHILWVDPQDLPENTLPHERQFLQCYRDGILTSKFTGYMSGSLEL
ncbi:MAG TPA: NUDIX domain-containing protein [Patescibacteria group bacterium]|jgi:ADP-ribose pyrophosphatase YjhB (NUDIX family)